MTEMTFLSMSFYTYTFTDVSPTKDPLIKFLKSNSVKKYELYSITLGLKKIHNAVNTVRLRLCCSCDFMTENNDYSVSELNQFYSFFTGPKNCPSKTSFPVTHIWSKFIHFYWHNYVQKPKMILWWHVSKFPLKITYDILWPIFLLSFYRGFSTFCYFLTQGNCLSLWSLF